MEEVGKQSIVSIIKKNTGKEIAKKGDSYIFLDTKSKVSDIDISKAINEQEEQYKKDLLEKELKSAREYISKKQHKFYTNYVKKDGETQEDLENINTEIQKCVSFIRENS